MSINPIYEHRFFLTIHDRICCLLGAAILLPMSLFIIATTIRQVSNIDNDSLEDVYIISTKSASAAICVISSILSIFITIACPYRRISFANMILSTFAAFGILMSLSTIFFKANWGNHHEALNKVIFIIVCSLCLVCSVSITIRIALRFKIKFSIENANEQLSTFLEQCSVIIATLLIIASFTSIAGFVIGYIIKYQLLLDKVFGGGLHSGVMGLLASLVFLAAIYGGPKSRFSLLSISMGVSILALISSAVSYYTEEIEIDHSVNYITKNQFAFFPNYHYRKILLMTKSTLILISSIFGLVFGSPLTVATCCLLKKDLLLQSSSNYADPTQAIINGKDNYEIEIIYGSYNDPGRQQEVINTNHNRLMYSYPTSSGGVVESMSFNETLLPGHKIIKSPILTQHHMMNHFGTMDNVCSATPVDQAQQLYTMNTTLMNQRLISSPSLSTNRIVEREGDVCDLLKELGHKQVVQ